MTFSEYAYLKEQVIISVCSTERSEHLLIALKELFRDTINSSRRFEQINTIGQLLKVLEIRDYLSEDDVKPLKKIVKRLPNSDTLLKRIVEYQDAHVPRENINYFSSEIKEKPIININRQPTQNILYTNPYGVVMSEIKQKRIHDTLAEEIGIYWKELGRNLKIPEYKIDAIDNQQFNTTRKAKDLMKLYLETKGDPQKWFIAVCEALDKTRRRDLSKTLQEIMTMNI